MVLPYANTDCMNVFLKEVSDRFPEDHIVMVMDCAAWQRSKTLKIPENMEIYPLLPYSPELNPVENIWDEVREKGFFNEIFKCMKDVETRLCDILHDLETDDKRVKGIMGWKWILSMF